MSDDLLNLAIGLGKTEKLLTVYRRTGSGIDNLTVLVRGSLHQFGGLWPTTVGLLQEFWILYKGITSVINRNC